MNPSRAAAACNGAAITTVGLFGGILGGFIVALAGSAALPTTFGANLGCALAAGAVIGWALWGWRSRPQPGQTRETVQ